jgi:hypothetical protein
VAKVKEKGASGERNRRGRWGKTPLSSRDGLHAVAGGALVGSAPLFLCIKRRKKMGNGAAKPPW